MSVVPAKAGTQHRTGGAMGPGFRRDDKPLAL